MSSGLRPGDIILTSEPTFASWIVQKITGCQYSHVGIYDGNNRYISSVPFKGVCAVRFSTIKDYAQYSVGGITDDERQQIVDFCTAKLGRKYDFIQALFLFWRIITDSLRTNAGDIRPNHYVCSELVAEAYASIGVNFGPIVDNVLPGTIIKHPRTVRKH